MTAVGNPAADAHSRVRTANDCDIVLCGEGIDISKAFAGGDFERSKSSVGDGSGITNVKL